MNLQSEIYGGYKNYNYDIMDIEWRINALILMLCLHVGTW